MVNSAFIHHYTSIPSILVNNKKHNSVLKSTNPTSNSPYGSSATSKALKGIITMLRVILKIFIMNLYKLSHPSK